tara:strand:- start:111 stop:281 length:171 start_codon:yes stop_codon:yes gene_type:complete
MKIRELDCLGVFRHRRKNLVLNRALNPRINKQRRSVGGYAVDIDVWIVTPDPMRDI